MLAHKSTVWPWLQVVSHAQIWRQQPQDLQSRFVLVAINVLLSHANVYSKTQKVIQTRAKIRMSRNFLIGRFAFLPKRCREISHRACNYRTRRFRNPPHPTRHPIQILKEVDVYAKGMYGRRYWACGIIREINLPKRKVGLYVWQRCDWVRYTRVSPRNSFNINLIYLDYILNFILLIYPWPWYETLTAIISLHLV